MSPPIRIQLSRKSGWRLPPHTASVARPSAWGNPYRVGRDGDRSYCIEQFRRLLLGETVDAWPKTKADADRAVFMPHADVARALLRGKNLACWCKTSDPCHADILLEIANG